jgi:hypothetical protein
MGPPGGTEHLAVTVLIDTGSTVNVISEAVAEELVKLGARAIPSEVPLDLGGTLAKVHSSHLLKLEVQTFGVCSGSVQLDFVVLDTTFQGILGYTAIKQLGLITLNAVLPAQTLQGVVDEFADLFTDNISTAATVTPFAITLKVSVSPG